jgi:hypothetical protein
MNDKERMEQYYRGFLGWFRMWKEAYRADTKWNFPDKQARVYRVTRNVLKDYEGRFLN